jgi:O-antigen/teichoic acid export membrane protein
MFNYGSQGISMLLNLSFSLIVSKFAGIKFFGEFLIITSMSSVLINLLSFRADEAAIAFYKKGQEILDFELSKAALALSIFLDLLTGLLVFSLLIFFSNFISIYFLHRAEASNAIFLYACFVLIQSLNSVPFSYLMLKDRFKFSGILGILFNASKLFIIFIFIKNNVNLTLENVITSLIIASCLIYLPMFLWVLNVIFFQMKSVKLKMKYESFKEYRKFVATTFLSSSLKAGFQNIDIFILGYVSGPMSTGTYGIFKQFFGSFSFFTSPLGVQLYPKFISAKIRNNLKKIRSAIVIINQKILLLNIFLAAMSLITLQLYLYIHHMKNTVPIVATFILLLASASLNNLLWWARSYSNTIDPTHSLKANFYSSILLLTFIFPLTKVFGMVGTAITMLLVSISLSMYWHRILFIK